MSAATCDRCAGWIDFSNVSWPGFCSAECRDADRARRDADRARRDAAASEKAQRRAAANRHRRATKARRDPNLRNLKEIHMSVKTKTVGPASPSPRPQQPSFPTPSRPTRPGR